MSAYYERLAALVEELINTYDTYLEEPEHLREPADLQRFLREQGIRVDAPIGKAELEAVRELRSQLREIWLADEEAGVAVDRLNGLLATACVAPQLKAGQEGTWRLEFAVEASTPLVRRLAVESALGLSAALAEHGFERMKACQAEPCRDVFIDTSRNRSRRFCSDRCANRYHIAAFRDRQRLA
ncbi:MAG: CGNR zinc finger domain-containing protein [Chloroflexi bacterium]|nr:CGNR zinc finger domain-containing protein [Chloroflexota bacterium]MCI0581001.1 CGNR zinc finger domain-containing protein [Chloroflexota bacterium]MCI0646340.1 CGNR zinc finger domain-containing protein [Chloroflexota bacterium]MCI0726962.1 CGNR zinc finger domain-containing protein [Chloroflexota bacterium]